MANLARVSKTTLYGNPDYRFRIEKLRQSTATSLSGASKRTVTGSGKDVLLAAKDKRICGLEAKIERLSTILKYYYGNEYDKY